MRALICLMTETPYMILGYVSVAYPQVREAKRTFVK